jgi:chemotaxis protein CheX
MKVNVQHINPFVRATMETWKLMLSSEAKPGKIKMGESKNQTHDVSGIIGLSGGAKGAISLSFEKKTAFRVVSKFIGEEINEMNDDILDGIGELANIIAGAAKKELSEFNISISLPTVITGKGHNVNEAKDVLFMVIPFTFETFTFELGVALKSVEH